MKKIFATSLVTVACMLFQTTNAQSVLSNLLSNVANAAAQSTTQQNNNGGKGSSSTATSNVLGAVLNTAVSTATEKTSEDTGNLIANLIASVTGDVTTTSASVVGTWNYDSPSVQFESQNYLTQAGGAAIAEKLEAKLASLYKLVNIRPGKMTFTFESNGNMTYGVGSVKRAGTYTFDNATKTLTLTTSVGTSFRCYVTVSGNTMYLTFDGDKFLNFVKTMGSRFSTLSTVVALVNNYEGMKVGFKFVK